MPFLFFLFNSSLLVELFTEEKFCVYAHTSNKPFFSSDYLFISFYQQWITITTQMQIIVSNYQIGIYDSGNLKTQKLILLLVVSFRSRFLDRELGLTCRSIDEDCLDIFFIIFLLSSRISLLAGQSHLTIGEWSALWCGCALSPLFQVSDIKLCVFW